MTRLALRLMTTISPPTAIADDPGGTIANLLRGWIIFAVSQSGDYSVGPRLSVRGTDYAVHRHISTETGMVDRILFVNAETQYGYYCSGILRLSDGSLDVSPPFRVDRGDCRFILRNHGEWHS